MVGRPPDLRGQSEESGWQDPGERVRERGEDHGARVMEG